MIWLDMKGTRRKSSVKIVISFNTWIVQLICTKNQQKFNSSRRIKPMPMDYSNEGDIGRKRNIKLRLSCYDTWRNLLFIFCGIFLRFLSFAIDCRLYGIVLTDLEVKESEKHIDKMMSFWRSFNVDWNDWIDDAKLSFLTYYHHDCNQASSVLWTWKAKQVNHSKMIKQKKGIQYNNELLGAL